MLDWTITFYNFYKLEPQIFFVQRIKILFQFLGNKTIHVTIDDGSQGEDDAARPTSSGMDLGHSKMLGKFNIEIIMRVWCKHV